jgi:hypothetical protein
MMPNLFVGVPLMLTNLGIWLYNLKVILLLAA